MPIPYFVLEHFLNIKQRHRQDVNVTVIDESPHKIKSMKPQGFRKTIALPDGREVIIETGILAKQAHGSVTLTCGNCVLLATVVGNREMKAGQDFFPLSVDYTEKFYSTGRIPGSFHRREGKISDYEVLISRLVDRALRPLFPDNYLFDVQVIISQISGDKEELPDALAGLAASAALTLSDIPFLGPISEVRVARIDGKFVINPRRSEWVKADIDVIIAATAKDVLMVEGEMKEVSEAELLEAITIGHAEIKKHCAAQLELAQEAGRTEKRTWEGPAENEEFKKQIEAAVSDKIYAVAKSASGKKERSEAFKAIAKEFVESMGEAFTSELAPLFKRYFHDVEKEVIRNMMLNDRTRLDGRKLDEVRPLWMDINALPSPHGAAVFTRGETQALATVTLGGSDDELMLDKAHEIEYSRFLLHYNFPSFSTGEIKPNRGPGRREIGHGNLAKRSLEMVIPTDCPYTIRIVSDVLESNGSSSMATVCAGSLALMDAGVKVTGGVSGIAMGMITSKDGSKYAILSDILGDEDHLGDMDFKVTGTAKGITGCQMDIKIDGLSNEVLAEALEQARRGRAHILNAMNEVISTPREDYKAHAPRIEKIIIDKEFIGAVIGPGGKIIQEMQRTTGTTISIEEINGVGEISILATEKESMEKAKAAIANIVYVPQIGDEFEAKVKSIKEFGAFVEFMPGKEGLLHISEISWSRLQTMDGVFNEGDTVRVKIIGTDPKTGKLRLSRKVLMPKPEGYVEREERAPREDRGPRRDDRGPRRDDRGPRRDDRGPRRDDRGPRTERPSEGGESTENSTPAPEA